MEIRNLFTGDIVSQINREMSEKTQKANYAFEITFMDATRRMQQTLMDYSTEKFVPLREAIQNALDANAQNIAIKAIQLSDGSQNVIITDDGKGMTREILSQHYFGWAKEAPEIDKRRGGFGLGSIAVLAGKRNFVVTKSDEGTYVGVYNKSFFLDNDEDAYPFFVGPFNCNLKDVFIPGSIKTDLIPNGNGTVLILENTNIFKKDNLDDYFTNKEIKNILLKKSHAGNNDYLLPEYPADKTFPYFRVEIEDNNMSERFYGYMRFVNYSFVRNYNKNHGTNWDLDTISCKEMAMAFYNEIVANGEKIKIVVEKLFPMDENNNDSVIMLLGNGEKILPLPLRENDSKKKYVNTSLRGDDYRGIFLSHDGLEIEKYANREYFPHIDLDGSKAYDYAYIILTHSNGILTSNRNAFNKEMDETFAPFITVGMRKVKEMLATNQSFLLELSLSSRKNNVRTEKAIVENRRLHLRLPEISVTTGSDVIKALFTDVKNTKCEKTTVSVYEKLYSIFTLLGKSKILPTITGYITKKGGSYDAFVKSIDSYTEDENAVLEFEYKLTDFKHPVDAVDYVACYTLGFPEDEEFKLCGQTAKIITRNNRKYIDLEKRGFPIGLFVMEDYLNDIDKFLK